MKADSLSLQTTSKQTTLATIVCGLAALFYVYDYFIQVAPSVMTHQLMQSFHIRAAQLGILSACFYYSYTLMQIPAGLLLDRFGARKLLTFAVFISAFGVTLFGSTHSFALAGLARFLIGLGSSFAFIFALFLVSRWFAHQHFALFAGLIALAGCLGSMFGEAPLAMMINHYGWRQTMVVTGLITFGLAAIYGWTIRDGKAPQSGHTTIALCSERKRLQFLRRQPQLRWIALCGLVSWVPVATVGALWGVPYLMQVYGLTNITAGKLCTLFWLGLGFGSPLLGWYSNRIGSRNKPMLLCFSCGLLAACLLIFAPQLPLWLIAAGLLLLGFSASLQALTFSIVKDVIPADVFGTASGINNMAAIIGGAISQPLVGWLLDLQWGGQTVHQVPVYSNQAYQIALLVVPVAALIGLLTTWLKVKETDCRLLHN